MKTFKSFSSADTKHIAATLAAEILRAKPRTSATVIALNGDLGAGKTTFVQGFFKGLGLKKRPASPTFILMRRTALAKGGFRNIFHIDAYRLKHPSELVALGIKEIFKDRENIVLIEWAEKVAPLLPKSTICLELTHGAVANERGIIWK